MPVEHTYWVEISGGDYLPASGYHYNSYWEALEGIDDNWPLASGNFYLPSIWTFEEMVTGESVTYSKHLDVEETSTGFVFHSVYYADDTITSGEDDSWLETIKSRVSKV